MSFVELSLGDAQGYDGKNCKKYFQVKLFKYSSVGRASFKGASLVQLFWLMWVRIPALRFKVVGKNPSRVIGQTTSELRELIGKVTEAFGAL